MVAVSLVAPGRSKRRVERRPKHTWNIQHRPWEIQPFMIAPVLPGETLKKLVFQSRVVTDPIINPIMGWWYEHSFFYVRFRDMYRRDLLQSMVMKPDVSLAAMDDASDPKYYHVNGTDLAINYPKMCLEAIVDSYFRFEGEVAGDYVNGTLYLASVNNVNYLDSVTNEDEIEGAAAAAFDDNLASTTAGQGDGTAAVMTSEILKATKEYEYARLMNVTDLTYEEWCAAYGTPLPPTARDEPELIRRITEWQYPSNTIDPTNGTPRSAVSWSCSGTADKNRAFDEPGFIVGLTVCRPKVYFKNLTSHATMLMRDAYGWLPPQLSADPFASFQKVSAGDPPVDLNTDAYYVDVKDIFVHGDQFMNFNPQSALPTGVISPNFVALPNAALTNKRYPASTDMDALFVNNTAGVAGVRADGVCDLIILGRQEDTSPTVVGTNKTV